MLRYPCFHLTLFPPGKLTSSSEPPTETWRRTVTQAITKASAVSQLIRAPGELKSPHAALGRQGTPHQRDATLPPTARGKRLSGLRRAAVPEGPRAEASHMGWDGLPSSLPATDSVPKATDTLHDAFPGLQRLCRWVRLGEPLRAVARRGGKARNTA